VTVGQWNRLEPVIQVESFMIDRQIRTSTTISAQKNSATSKKLGFSTQMWYSVENNAQQRSETRNYGS
jgi:plasmid maintenance system antidote protein VapI